MIRLSGRYGYFDHVFTGLLVGNHEHLRRWAACSFEGRGLPAPTRRACKILQSWILEPERGSDAEPAASRIKFDTGLHNAFLGLARGDVGLINGGVAALLKTWPRTDLAVWDGQTLPFINIPAICVLRTARRIGLTPDLPEVEGMDLELVHADDPQESHAPFALYPGLSLMISERELEPATLFVNERILRADDQA